MKIILEAKNNFRHYVNHGSSLLEIVVALGAIAVLFTITSTAIISALNNATESKFQNQASIFASEGIEILRQMKESSWNTFDSYSGNYCLADNCKSLTSFDECGPTVSTCGKNIYEYSRSVTLLRNDPDCTGDGNNSTKAIVKVSWHDSKCAPGIKFCRNVSMETCFSNIYYNSGL